MVNLWREYSPTNIWGGYISSNLSWDDHITQICSRAKRQMGVLYRRFYHGCLPVTLNLQALKMCYLCKLIHELVFLPNCPIRYKQNCQHDLAPTLSMFHLLIVMDTTSIFVMLHGNGTIYLQKLFHPHLSHLLKGHVILLYLINCIFFLGFLFWVHALH